MTGVEAVSNGVPAFRPPESKNASATLVAMAALSITMFVGITVLAHAYHVMPSLKESGVSQLGRAIFGGGTAAYYLLQVATTLILVLAANTAYADFPRLASIVSRDRFLPRQFMNQGDRLAFSNGIMVLSVFAAVLIVAFRGDTQALLPLYMIGVFISFTLSQAGMVVHWRRTREPGWTTNAFINGFGAVGHRRRPGDRHRHQDARGRVDRPPAHPDHRRRLQGHARPLRSRVGRSSRCAATRRRRGCTTRCSCRSAGCSARSSKRCATPRRCPTTCARCTWTWTRRRPSRCAATGTPGADGSQLVVLPSPYRSVMEPLLEYIEQVERERPNDYVTVILPEFVPRRWWQHLLHNQRALLIKGALLFRPNTVVTSVPFHLAK